MERIGEFIHLTIKKFTNINIFSTNSKANNKTEKILTKRLQR